MAFDIMKKAQASMEKRASPKSKKSVALKKALAAKKAKNKSVFLGKANLGGAYTDIATEKKKGSILPKKVTKKTKGGEYPVYKKKSASAVGFRQAFSAARKARLAGKNSFTIDGQKFPLNKKGDFKLNNRSYNSMTADDNKKAKAASVKKSMSSLNLKKGGTVKLKEGEGLMESIRKFLGTDKASKAKKPKTKGFLKDSPFKITNKPVGQALKKPVKDKDNLAKVAPKAIGKGINAVVDFVSPKKSYKVKSGDTLSQIAKKNGLTVAALMKANPNIKNANKIGLGQVINMLPKGKAANPYKGMSKDQMTGRGSNVISEADKKLMKSEIAKSRKDIKRAPGVEAPKKANKANKAKNPPKKDTKQKATKPKPVYTLNSKGVPSRSYSSTIIARSGKTPDAKGLAREEAMSKKLDAETAAFKKRAAKRKNATKLMSGGKVGMKTNHGTRGCKPY